MLIRVLKYVTSYQIGDLGNEKCYSLSSLHAIYGVVLQGYRYNCISSGLES